MEMADSITRHQLHEDNSPVEVFLQLVMPTIISRFCFEFFFLDIVEGTVLAKIVVKLVLLIGIF